MAIFSPACRFHGAHAMDMSIIQPVEGLYGTGDSSRANENRLRWGNSQGGRRHVLVRSYLAITPRPRQPEAATPGSWTQVASAPSAWSCIQGKSPFGNGAIVFSGAFRVRAG